MPQRDDDVLDPKELGRSKEEEGRFTLTPAERKLARETARAGAKLDREAADKLEEGQIPSLASPNPFEREPKGSVTTNYARGGMVKHGSSSRAPAICKGGKVITSRSY